LTADLKAKGLEIIFVSSDRDAASFQEYYATMPWLAIPRGDPRKEKLSKLFGVQGIPAFALVDAATGKTINANARGKVTADPTGEDFPFHPKPLIDMVAEGPGDINEETTLCVMMEGCDADVQSRAMAALEPIAAAAKAAEEEVGFLYASTVGGPTEQIRKLAKIGEPSSAPQMVLFDIPDNGGYYVSPATEITATTVTDFLSAYKAGSLERKQLG
jgi:nucleoredoxin